MVLNQVAQNSSTPEIVTDLIELSWWIGWIDPNGIIYPIENVWHEEWVENNINYLENKYSGLDLYYAHSSDYSDILTRNGWIRIRENDLSRISFTIDNILNHNRLKVLEELFFDALDPEDRFRITIEDYNNKRVVFDWKDFIKSGMNFVDFVKERISPSYANKVNWYKLAQLKPIEQLEYKQLWIDPSGQIFDSEGLHSAWVQRNKEELENEYDIDFSSNESIIKPLINNGWIRITKSTNDLLLAFDVDDINNSKSLRIIGESLFDFLNPSSNMTIWVNEYNANPFMAFDWQDFVESGENFIDFVMREARA